MLILTSGLGAFFKWTHSGNDARDYLLQVISDQVAPSLATAVEQSLGQIQDYSPLSGPIGMAILLLAALAIFAQFERAFDRIWNMPHDHNLHALASMRRMLTYRLRAFAMLAGLGVLVIAVFAVGVVTAALQRHLGLDRFAWLWWALELCLEIGINAFAFALLYRFLPKVRVRWKDATRGGLLAALIWELGRQLLATFVIGQHYTNAYGIIGGFLAIMLWGYYAVAVIFLGAEFVQALGEKSVAENSEASSKAHAKRRPDAAAIGRRLSRRLPKSVGRIS